MKNIILALSIITITVCGNATAQDRMTVQSFLESANSIPHNPIALLDPRTRPLMHEVEADMHRLEAEQQAMAGTVGQTLCMPERVRLSADDILTRLNAIPQQKRSQTVLQAFREWMTERYPC